MGEVYAGTSDPIREAPPQRLSWACGQVTNEMVDEGRAHVPEGARTPEEDREFWQRVREKLERWPDDGP